MRCHSYLSYVPLPPFQNTIAAATLLKETKDSYEAQIAELNVQIADVKAFAEAEKAKERARLEAIIADVTKEREAIAQQLKDLSLAFDEYKAEVRFPSSMTSCARSKLLHFMAFMLLVLHFLLFICLVSLFLCLLFC